jgi:hypothetical protein
VRLGHTSLAAAPNRTTGVCSASAPCLWRAARCRLNAQPLIVDSKPRQEYPASLKCSQTKNAPAGRKFKLTAVEIWHEQLLAGLHMINCDSG